MLAKEIKIHTLYRQKLFIQEELVNKMNSVDGNPSYSYVGYLYPENRIYFQDEGYNVIQVKADEVSAKTRGLPLWVFTPCDAITLTEEELQTAEAYAANDEDEEDDKEYGEDDEYSKDSSPFQNFFDSIFG